ncbi:NAD(P)H-dependent oxidoreductase [Vagococcus fluvialis]|uniref:NAD(P)H-dependent oxidoreductase n=1 Tax=Enterococcaceae TaxID=81852 RepID=UPI001A0D3B06|nr:MULTISPECIES: NAD(P)H-dependent oxidoreductase [Enterococcus]EGO8851042.1 flavodoxin family protein [Enterococcus faecalis]EKK5287763.1 NAD(P)H-dependent oxidoreductase [Enterococcus faecalis]MDT2990923.1 NAD(P)H-dependent oxidoreductase [Enterococcus casseliflavus]MDV7842947.1 NAD(P)H-dependent oxidoreductase [Enterococcus faecalis]UYY26433.1 NAD(P)H-dependent oxidoreductase [Enterococcus faecalis]
MKILVISSYPNHTGFNYIIKKTVLDNINSMHEVTEIDLYKEQFDPVLHFDENHRRRDLVSDPYTEKYRELIKASDLFIFIYPIWWGGMPAILKGFIDRVFVKGFAYEYKGIFPVPLLKQKKAWIINSNDTPYLYARFVQKDYGRILRKQILNMCGIKTIKHSQIYFVRSSTKQKRIKFLNKIAKISQKIK